ncbi:alpha/beta fold hydrolase [Dactylosporangium sp. NPDC051541]|uniref:alpha/beta fold hydrolase n=1 Tax=Dactylosporangium sp. NPDC051541 TaxID=3363977 RepID=UPI00379C0BFB
MTEFLNVDGGTLAYEVSGDGPLIVLAPGMGNSREAYRFITPELVAAGYRVAAVDLRGCGESSVGWASYSRTDIAGDLIALVEHLGGPAVLVGHSIAGGAATIAAATAPQLFSAIVELAPFTRAQAIKLGDFRVARYRKGAFRLLGSGLFGSVRLWKQYLDIAYPGRKPADWHASISGIDAMMREPGRMRAMQKMGRSAPKDAAAQLGNVRCPVLIIEGSLDPDWVSPQAEGEAIVAALPAGLGRLEMIAGAGHYPHVQYPAEVLDAMLTFIK